MIEIQQHNTTTKGDFEILVDGKHAGIMTYVWAGTDKFIIDHTEVDDHYNGLGLGKKLVVKAVEFAREKQVKIIPLCPFAKLVLSGKKEYQDVLL